MTMSQHPNPKEKAKIGRKISMVSMSLSLCLHKFLRVKERLKREKGSSGMQREKANLVLRRKMIVNGNNRAIMR